MPPKKLLDQLRDAVRLKHYSIHTEKTYVEWARRYILYHNKRHPREMGIPEIEEFLTHLASDQQLSASTHNQALSAILFLYREVLKIELPENVNTLWVRGSRPIPTVLSKAEVRKITGLMSGTPQLMIKLIYGSGLRLTECLRLRVKDLDFEYRQIIVRKGKGERDRYTTLPQSLIPLLQDHLESVRYLHRQDIADGFGCFCQSKTRPFAREKRAHLRRIRRGRARRKCTHSRGQNAPTPTILTGNVPG